MDTFFTQEKCDRCSGELSTGRTMSMFNTACICIDCSEKEEKRRDYKKACDADHEQIKNGNFNYKGMGFKT